MTGPSPAALPPPRRGPRRDRGGAAAGAEPRPRPRRWTSSTSRASPTPSSRPTVRRSCTRERAELEGEPAITHVHRVNVDGAAARQMTNGAAGESSARWSPDGRTFIFLAQRPGSDVTQVHLMSNDGGEARPLTHHPTAVSRPSGRATGPPSTSSPPSRRRPRRRRGRRRRTTRSPSTRSTNRSTSGGSPRGHGRPPA